MRTIAYLIIAAFLTSGAAPATQPATASSPEIVRVVSRHQVVVVRKGVDGPTYSVESKTGTVLVPAMPMDQLVRANPDAAKSVKTMQADVLWAGMDVGGE